MEADFRLRDSRIAIIGLGLMGGSLALALRGKCAALYGIDSDRATLKFALDQGVVDQADSNPANLLPQADLVILATPVPKIIEFIYRLPSFIQKPCIVFDLGSTKVDIVRAMSVLPEHFDPIGGHPICGKEKLGVENAEAGLFRNAPFITTPLGRSSWRARNAAAQIISAVGARPIELEDEAHVRALAFTSHLPFLVSSTLALATPEEYVPFSGTGFRSTSRLAGTSSSIMLGILQSNRENVLKALSVFQQHLSEIQTKLAAGDDRSLENFLNDSRTAYQSVISNL
jgi:prephenate dehydrogenase